MRKTVVIHRKAVNGALYVCAPERPWASSANVLARRRWHWPSCRLIASEGGIRFMGKACASGPRAIAPAGKDICRSCFRPVGSLSPRMTCYADHAEGLSVA